MGFFPQDTVQIGNLNVTDFVFEEWTSASCYSVGCYNGGYDGALGLVPPWSSKSNMLSAMLSQDLLDSPIFSLILPLYEKEQGELLFGATDPALHNSDFVTLPVINQTSDQRFIDSWIVAASHSSFDTPHPLQISLPPTGYAVLDIALPYIILPSEFARNLTAAIGATPGPAWFHSIPCERRQELPTLTLTLGGHNCSISAFEYIHEIEVLFGEEATFATPPQRMCISTFVAADEFGFPSDWEGMILGHPCEASIVNGILETGKLAVREDSSGMLWNP